MKLNSSIIQAFYKVVIGDGLLDDSPAFLEQAKADLKQLEREYKIEALIPIMDIAYLIQHLFQSYKPHELGWMIGSKLKTHDLGVFGYYLFSCKHAFYAQQKLGKYQLLLSDLVNFNFEISREEVVWNITLPFFDTLTEQNLVQCMSNFEIAFRHKIVTELCQKDFYPAKIALNYSYGEDEEAFLKEKYRCEVAHQGYASALHYHFNDISQPIPSANYHIYYKVESILNDLLQRWYENSSDYSVVVRRLILSNLGYAQFSFQMVADKLNMSTRHLQRLLKEENTSYKNILQDCRKEMSLIYIQRNLNNHQIAQKLGYTETNSFIRSFKKWFGKSTKEYRIGE